MPVIPLSLSRGVQTSTVVLVEENTHYTIFLSLSPSMLPGADTVIDSILIPEHLARALRRTCVAPSSAYSTSINPMKILRTTGVSTTASSSNKTESLASSTAIFPAPGFLRSSFCSAGNCSESAFTSVD